MSRALRKENALTLEEAWGVLAPPRVLIAAPHPLQLVQKLRQDGFRVDAARTCYDLARLVGAGYYSCRHCEPYDLIILDLRLAGPSALAVLSTLRELDAEVPFVVVVEPSDDRSRREAIDLGARVLESSFDLDDLRTVVVNTVTRR
jgi:DNA-binding response OmpR family regulator